MSTLSSPAFLIAGVKLLELFMVKLNENEGQGREVQARRLNSLRSPKFNTHRVLDWLNLLQYSALSIIL